MNVVIIGDSSMLYMPYIRYYEEMLIEKDINYTIINWDRFQIGNDVDGFQYRDNKVGHKRGFFDYLFYFNFVKGKLETYNYDKVIVCGIPLSFFLKKYLLKNYEGKYIIDIRDYHKILRITNIESIIKSSAFTVLSSLGFKEWLPSSEKYIVNHNTKIYSIDELQKTEVISINPKIDIAYIGAIRDYEVNINFINSLKNNSRINLYFHGEGHINKDIQHYLDSLSIKNVCLTGRYEKKDEKRLFKKTDFINIIVPNTEINSKTLLPNRLYNALIYGKPIISFSGTYLSEEIKKYKLGLILNSFEEVESEIINYINEFDVKAYEEGRKRFISKVINENNNFRYKLEEFLCN